ncbi:MAG: amino acid adenylation domain-containing protein [Anaerolineae bacterium]
MTEDRDDAAIEAVYPLSPLQAGMLFHNLLGVAAGVDVQQIVGVLRERLSLPLFEQAWRQAAARHAVLRTAFRWSGSEGLAQAVYREVALPIAFEDWRSVPADEQPSRLTRYCRDDWRRGFALDRPPLMRLTVVQWADAEFRFVWTFHHALLDGRSYDLLLQEVFALYEAFQRGESVSPPPARPYRDYILWLQDQAPAASAAAWRDLLTGFAAPTPLPDIRPAAPPPPDDDYGMQELWLSEETTAGLTVTARTIGVSVSTLVQGAWALLLSRLSGEDDVVFGVTRTCRHSALGGVGADRMIGLLINTLPMRARVRGEQAIAAWLRELRAQSLAVRAHEHTPLASVQEWSDLPPGAPLFDSIVVYENFRLDTRLKALGGAWQQRDFDVFGRTSYPLTLLAYQDRSLLLRLKHDRARFGDTAASRMLGHLAAILARFVASPALPLDSVSLLTPEEEHQILTAWTAPWTDNAVAVCFHQVFAAQAARTPDALAVVYEDTRLTYRDLDELSNRLAWRLRAVGIGPEAVAGIYLDRSAATVVALLAILKAGGAYLPLDVDQPAERVSRLLREARAAALVTRRSLVERMPPIGVPVVCVDDSDDSASPARLPNLARPANLAYVLFTSGSTGQPKGVAIEHRQVMAYLRGVVAALDLPASAAYALVSTFAADLGNTMIFPALARGGCLHVIASERAATPDAFADYVARHRIDCLKIVPSHLAALLSAAEPARALPRQRLVLGGEAASPALVARVHALAPHCRAFNHYGPTETTVGVLTYPILPADAAGPIPLGRPLPNTRVYILDSAMQPAPVGRPGELYIGGDTVGRGYIHRPDLTAERFVPNPLTGSDPRAARLYRTGDRVRWREDGVVEFLGRVDDQVKIRGYRVEPGEVAAALTQHPAVAASAATVWEDERGEKHLAAYVVPAASAVPDDLPLTLTAFLRGRLPEHMLPAGIVPLDDIPLTSNGKIDRRALPPLRLAQNPPPSAYVAPRNAAEAALAAIWADLLRLERVGVNDSFFALGGDSILSIRLVAAAQRAGLRLTPRLIFEHPTIAALAALAALDSGRDVPLTPYQRALLDAGASGRQAWSVRVVRTQEALDVSALTVALAVLAGRHDALRLRVSGDGSAWRAWAVDGAEAVALTVERAPDTGPWLDERIGRLAADLDPTAGALVRVVLFEMDTRGAVLALAAHALAADTASWPILLADLETAYRQTQRGAPVSLPPSASFLRWSAGVAGAADMAAGQWVYWQDALAASSPPVFAGPPDGARHHARVTLSEEETRTFMAAQAPYRTQPEEVLLAAAALAVGKALAADSCLATITADARLALVGAEVTRGVGPFLAAFPLPLDLAALCRARQDSPDQAVIMIKERLRRVPAGGIGFGLLPDLAATTPSTLGFCYLGVTDTSPGTEGGWAVDAALLRPTREAAAFPHRPIEIVTWIEDHRLHLWVAYDCVAFDRAAADAFAQSLFHELSTLAYHLSFESVGRFTPADFLDAHLGQDELDDLLSSLE